MSTDIWERDGVAVSSYAGPPTADGKTRKRYQITNELTGEYVTLSADQYSALSPRLLGGTVPTDGT